MSEIFNQYNGSIQFERILKANLPSKTSGKKIFFVVNNSTDKIGEIWATRNDGVVVCYSVATDIDAIIKAISDMKDGNKAGSLQQQINILSDERGYETTKNVGGNTDISTLPNGIYTGYNPVGFDPGTIFNLIKVNKLEILNRQSTDEFWFRNYNIDGTSREWQQVVTKMQLNNALAINNLSQVQEV